MVDAIVIGAIATILALAGAAGITLYYLKSKKPEIGLVLGLLLVFAVALSLIVPILMQAMCC